MGLFGKLILAGFSFYAGAYVDQHYQLPILDNPQQLWNRALDYFNKMEKSDDAKDLKEKLKGLTDKLPAKKE